MIVMPGIVIVRWSSAARDYEHHAHGCGRADAEIGLRKSLGARRRDVLRQLLAESTAIAAAARLRIVAALV